MSSPSTAVKDLPCFWFKAHKLIRYDRGFKPQASALCVCVCEAGAAAARHDRLSWADGIVCGLVFLHTFPRPRRPVSPLPSVTTSCARCGSASVSTFPCLYLQPHFHASSMSPHSSSVIRASPTLLLLYFVRRRGVLLSPCFSPGRHVWLMSDKNPVAKPHKLLPSWIVEQRWRGFITRVFFFFFFNHQQLNATFMDSSLLWIYDSPKKHPYIHVWSQNFKYFCFFGALLGNLTHQKECFTYSWDVFHMSL